MSLAHISCAEAAPTRRAPPPRPHPDRSHASFTLTGVPDTTVSSDNAVTMTVTTNKGGGSGARQAGSTPARNHLPEGAAGTRSQGSAGRPTASAA